MTDQQIIQLYAARMMTIRELAQAAGRPFKEVRWILVKAGYHYGKI